MSSKSVRVNLRAFAIKEKDTLTNVATTLATFKEKLQALNKAIDRCMLLSQSDPNKERDLISNFETSETPNSVFCTMLRIAPGEDALHVTSDLLERPAFAIEELESIYGQGPADQDKGKNTPPAIRKEHYYFSINDRFLVTNLRPGKTIRDLQTYLAWLIGNDLFELYPLTQAPNNITLNDVRNITFSGASIGYNSLERSSEKRTNGREETETISLSALALSKLRNVFPGIKSLNQHDLERFVSAELVLKIKKPTVNEQERFQKTMGALLLPVADLENISIRPKRGKTITGKDLAKEKPVEIAVTTTGLLVEQALKQEMSRFLTELDND